MCRTFVDCPLNHFLKTSASGITPRNSNFILKAPQVNLNQWFSNFQVLQNHLESLLNSVCGAHPRGSGSVDLGMVQEFALLSKFQVTLILRTTILNSDQSQYWKLRILHLCGQGTKQVFLVFISTVPNNMK